MVTAEQVTRERTYTPTGLQQLRELTNTENDDPIASDGNALMERYRRQYTYGWKRCQQGAELTEHATGAHQHGYDDYNVGLPKWCSLAETGLLD